ncbi:hypothetical protein N7508_001122 [Penicillium antarcticum]|uniref:uncharacterized protein n=1 Tax=Penicillium antarcticum TaxID=416450 RepID=UPI0023833EC7|nr:uncharacterized protein N7508_001122 [Penicillium antarcticum]KAJ5316614.1 hypothetical protein N7508_001122 [Penicillium antarcticum]
MDGRDAPSREVHVENSANTPVNHTTPAPVETQRAPLSLRVDGLSVVAVAPGDGNSTPAYIESEHGSDTSDGRRPDLYSASTFTDSLSSFPSSNDTSRFPEFGNSYTSNEHGPVPQIDQTSSQCAMAPAQPVSGNSTEKWQPSLPTIQAGNGSPSVSPMHSRTKSNFDELAPGQKRTATGDIKPVSLETPVTYSEANGAARRRSKSTGSSAYGSRIAQLSVHIRTRLSYAAAKVEKEKEKARLSLEAGPHPTLRTYHSASPLSNAPSDIASAPEMHPPSLSHQSSNSSNGNSSRFPSHSRSRSAFSSPHLLSIPKLLAPPVDIISSNGDTRRRRPDPNAISKPNHSPVSRHRRHHSHQENGLNLPVLGPGTPSLSSTTRAPTSTPNGFYRPRTNSENTSMEQDAIETLMFMSSPENSGYRFSPRPLQPESTQSSLNGSINTNGTNYNGSQDSQSSSAHSGRGYERHETKQALESHAGDDIDRLLDQMDSDSEDEGRYASYRPAISGAHPFRGHQRRQR